MLSFEDSNSITVYVNPLDTLCQLHTSLTIQFSCVWQSFHIDQANLNWVVSLHIKTNLNCFGKYCKSPE